MITFAISDCFELEKEKGEREPDQSAVRRNIFKMIGENPFFCNGDPPATMNRIVKSNEMHTCEWSLFRVERLKAISCK